MPKDFLDEVIAARSKKNPRFPDLVAEAERRRALARDLAARRASAGLSQTVVAAQPPNDWGGEVTRSHHIS
jgi:hypothetical protein